MVQTGGGTSREYLIERLRRAQRLDLVSAIERGEVSAYAASIEMGWHRRRPTISGEDCNQARRRAFAIARAVGRAPPLGPRPEPQSNLPPTPPKFVNKARTHRGKAGAPTEPRRPGNPAELAAGLIG